jgi:hypothetical protein
MDLCQDYSNQLRQTAGSALTPFPARQRNVLFAGRIEGGGGRNSGRTTLATTDRRKRCYSLDNAAPVAEILDRIVPQAGGEDEAGLGLIVVAFTMFALLPEPKA